MAASRVHVTPASVERKRAGQATASQPWPAFPAAKMVWSSRSLGEGVKVSKLVCSGVSASRPGSTDSVGADDGTLTVGPLGPVGAGDPGAAGAAGVAADPVAGGPVVAAAGAAASLLFPRTEAGRETGAAGADE